MTAALSAPPWLRRIATALFWLAAAWTALLAVVFYTLFCFGLKDYLHFQFRPAKEFWTPLAALALWPGINGLVLCHLAGRKTFLTKTPVKLPGAKTHDVILACLAFALNVMLVRTLRFYFYW